jgi:hypothetical protein
MSVSFSDFLASPENENPDAKRFNEDLIYNIRQESLADYVVKAFKIIECKYIKIIDWELITDESKFDSNRINVKYIKNNKNKKFDKRIPINGSRFDLLKIRFRITLNSTCYIKTIKLLLFKKIDNYYYILDGNRFYPIYQLVDASVYNRKNYLTLKTHSTPIIIKRENENIMDVGGENYMIPAYKMCMFKQRVNILLIFFALMGFENTLRFMQMDEIIKVNRYKLYDANTEYCFMSDNGIYVKVLKYFFDNDYFTRYMTYSVLDAIKDYSTMNEVLDPTHTDWIVRVGELLTRADQDDDKKFIKGKGFMLSFAKSLDEFTKDELRVKSFNKGSIFAVVRWILRNFNELKAKNNMDIRNKRIRLGEYQAFYLVRNLNQRNRKFITNMINGEIKVENVEELLNMDQDYFIKAVTGSKSSLMKYDNSVNDMDMFVALKYSLKGPSSIGEKSSNAVSVEQRDIHESYVGPIDINSSSNSDPGMSGNFTPFAKLYGKFFTDEQEPQNWDTDFANLYNNYFNGAKLPIKPLDYYYNIEKKSRKAIKHLDEVLSFVHDDPHIGNKQLFVDVRKNKPRVVSVIDLDKKAERENQTKALPEPIRVRRRKKKSNKMRVVKVKRIKS